jgi:hypothetical protein
MVMRECLRSANWRAVIGLIAAYAIALQAVFTALAPMPVQAAGNADPFAAHCYGNGNAGLPESGEPGDPAPISGKMHCVFCGACAAGFVVLPPVVADVHRQAAAPVIFADTACTDLPVADKSRDGPARAPPLTV